MLKKNNNMFSKYIGFVNKNIYPLKFGKYNN